MECDLAPIADAITAVGIMFAIAFATVGVAWAHSRQAPKKD